MRRFAKSVSQKCDRGFESPSLRLSRTAVPSRAVRAAVLFCAALGLSACVERTLFIRTDPPGAEVLLDSKRVGKSPVEVPFTYGGTHEIIVYRHNEKDAAGLPVAYRPKVIYYDTENVTFDGPVLDVFVDLNPIPIRDDHVVDIPLEKSDALDRYRVSPDAFLDSLRERADVVRRRARESQLDARPLSEADGRPESRPAAPAPDSRPTPP
jgi:hypothetical protein